VDEVQVHVVEPEALERRVQLGLGIALGRAQLRRHEHLLARDRARGERAPDAALVAVQRGRVDVPVAGLERPGHRLLGLRALGQLPDAQPEQGHGGARRQGDGGVCGVGAHGQGPTPCACTPRSPGGGPPRSPATWPSSPSSSSSRLLGNLVHDSVAELSTLGRGVTDAGTAAAALGRERGRGRARRSGERGGRDRARADRRRPGRRRPAQRRRAGDRAVEREAGQAGGSVAAAGRDGEQRALDAARVLGWVTFLVPLILLVSRWLPPRIRQVQAMAAAERVLRGDGPRDPARERALAERAAFGLPYATLLRHTRDPLGDLVAGNHAPLIAAVGEDAGLALTPRASRAPAGRPA
jgi:hypothetical protein